MAVAVICLVDCEGPETPFGTGSWLIPPPEAPVEADGSQRACGKSGSRAAVELVAALPEGLGSMPANGGVDLLAAGADALAAAVCRCGLAVTGARAAMYSQGRLSR